MRVAIYARVSTRDKGQDPENQLHQLRDFAERHGTIYKVFTEEISGGKPDRSEFKQLLLEAYQMKFDLVVFWRLDRFSREGALPTLKYLKELRDHGVNYKSFTEPYLDSLGPFGDVIVSMLATIAAQDLIKISENTKASLAKKKAAGVQLGAPTKSPAVIALAQALKAEGKSKGAIARALGISPSTVAKYVASTF
ncbi:Site-specific DNA recombinase [Hymenobacter daecheongensis DSM 21074]|uniref:Site-specific DNA recombinase n=1 Tax=Hymenobacter daecheongensis DSM 21074 TaxID=1121955 RepID=A0A1M6J047_9BACT|nr:recombinase family protein [Hymenobacter daecheongensis]SHJ40073.1 Site-specific DNA recombinase [Hymenobacter daecheongensis DSM 21074]